MTAKPTAAAARAYWERHYADQFVYGLGTEDILAALMQVPPVDTWIDFGSGSESLLWSIALRARTLIAVDIDPHRLNLLHQFAATARPRQVHTTALHLCGRTHPDGFTHRCRALTTPLHADCLTGPLPDELAERQVDLVTQFGLLGLCRDPRHFSDQFTEIHRSLAPGGWSAGANWTARDTTGRVDLTPALYRATARRAGIGLLLLFRTASADLEFPTVWTYVGRRNTP